MRICGIYTVRGARVRVLSIRGTMCTVWVLSGPQGRLTVPIDEVKDDTT